MTLDLGFYLALFLRRLPVILAFLVLGGAAGLFLSLTQSPTYRAEARLIVESSQIPGELAQSTVRANAVELLQVITERLVTRAYLLDVAQSRGFYAGTPEISPDEIVEDMGRRMQILMPGLTDPAPVATIHFDAPEAEASAEVVNDLVTKILQENTEVRTELARETLDFFEREVARLDGDLSRQGAKILEFKEENKEALPDSLEFRRLRQTAQQERLLQTDRELSSLKERRSQLQEIFARTGQVDLLNDTRSPEQIQLQALESQLASARILYADDNPILQALETQVEALDAAVEAQLSGRDGSNPALTAFELQLADIDAQIDFLDSQKAQLQGELSALAISIEATPSNAITLGTLERDFENIQAQYNQAADRLAQASTGDRIEAQSRGQRITVVEPAIVPTRPIAPNRKLLTAAGLGGGLLAGIGLFVLLELLNSTVRRPQELVSGLGIVPFATIPYYRTLREARRRRWRIFGTLFGTPAVLAAGLAAVHLTYMPLDLLVDDLRARLGIGGASADAGSEG
jgi:polysaccharide biosynthesis transport protein